MLSEEAKDALLRLIVAHSDLRNSIEDEDGEETLKATKTSALLSMKLLNFMPGIDNFGIKHVTAEEMSELEKKLNTLLSL